ncbi:MAG: hypothetical protein IJF84_09135 [Thermoguttaceae bacterium]|nr:hypothetical protein [Thermoguttaceae bacterium]
MASVRSSVLVAGFVPVAGSALFRLSVPQLTSNGCQFKSDKKPGSSGVRSWVQ